MATQQSLAKHRLTIEFVTEHLPKLSSDDVPWDEASDPSDDYNCMGLAVGFLRWWQPPAAAGLSPNPRDYWPPNVDGDVINISVFISAATTMGFALCDAPDWEPAYVKIVLLDDNGDFAHAAVQVSPGSWKSKFGNLSDFEHSLSAIDGPYGAGRTYMRKLRSLDSA